MMIKRLLLTIFFSFLIIITFSLIVYSNLLNEKFVLRELDNMNYYDYAYNEITSKLESELPNKDLTYVYDKYVTKERIKSDVKSILDNYHTKRNTKIKDDFYKVVFENFGSKNDENIKTLSNNLANTYFNNLFRIERLNKVINKLTIKNSLKAITFVLLFVFMFLIFLSIKNLYFFNSFLVSGLIFLLPKLLINLKDIIKNFYYYNNTLSYFIKMYVYDIINIYFKTGLLFSLIGIIGISIFYLRKVVHNKRQLTKNVE